MAAASDPPDSTTQFALNAQSLTRRLSSDMEVHEISLSLARGDIVGLLGLNGAGKSTTLRMLSGVLRPDKGTVTINGFSLSEQPLSARSELGYLPDTPPLYDDMRVSEYLSFTGKVRDLKGKALSERLSVVIEQCMLGSVQRQLIGSLSKGFRQRVGLAQAIIHEPALLLLDEPNNGLDPQQLDSMRQLIKEISKNSAVLLSTHLLSEAQSLCNRVAIMHRGKLVADRPANGADLADIFQAAIQ